MPLSAGAAIPERGPLTVVDARHSYQSERPSTAAAAGGSGLQRELREFMGGAWGRDSILRRSLPRRISRCGEYSPPDFALAASGVPPTVS